MAYRQLNCLCFHTSHYFLYTTLSTFSTSILITRKEETSSFLTDFFEYEAYFCNLMHGFIKATDEKGIGSSERVEHLLQLREWLWEDFDVWAHVK